mmetsp:Transcript_281/g.910  ORF Transcript_281/g.910 Transcript_281/m.910 type:complete len:94 (-) Transcript_281:2123-2404(-)
MLAAREGSQHLYPHCGHLPSRKIMLVTPMSSALRPGGIVQTASFFELEKGGDGKNEEFLRSGGIDSHHHQRGVMVAMVVVGNKGGGSAGTRWK